MPIDPKQILRMLGSAPAGLPRLEAIVFMLDVGDPISHDGNGTEFHDLSNNANSDEIVNTGVTVIDSHLNFDGVTDRIVVARPAAMDNTFGGAGGTSGATISVWVRIESVGGGSLGRIGDTKQNASAGWVLNVRGGSNPTGCYLDFGQDFSITGGLWRLDQTTLEGAVPFGVWKNITVVYNNNSVSNDPTFYIDGVAAAEPVEATAPVGTRVDDSGNDLVIGNGGGFDRGFDGDIDMFAQWNEQLSASEVMQFVAATRPRYQGGTGFALVDRVVVTAAISTVTLNGLDSQRDGIYLVVGKAIGTENGFFELRPVPGGILSSIASTVVHGDVNAGVTFTSTTGWVVAGGLSGDATLDHVTFFQSWIWPSQERHGAAETAVTAARMMRSTGVSHTVGGAQPEQVEGWGQWLTTVDSDHFESITLTGIGGLNLEIGSEVSIYKLGYGVDPI